MITDLIDYSATTFNILGAYGPSGSRTGYTLDSLYVHGVSGDGYAIRVQCRADSPITEFYCFVNAVTGAPPATMTCEIRGYQTGQSSRAGSVLNSGACVATASTPAVANSWVKFTFAGGAQYTPARGEVIWFVVSFQTGSPDASNNIQLLQANALAVTSSSALFRGVTTSTGFSTNGGVLTGIGVYKTADGSVRGNPVTRAVGASSFAGSRGMRVLEGFNVPIKIGVISPTTMAPTGSLFELWLNDDGPSGTPAASHTTTAEQAGIGGVFVGTGDEWIVPAETPFRLTFRPASGTTSGPGYAQIEDGASYPDVQLSLPLDGKVFYTIESAGAWVDDPYSLPRMHVLVSQIEASGSSYPRASIG